MTFPAARPSGSCPSGSTATTGCCDREAAAELLVLVLAAQVLAGAFGVQRLEPPGPMVAALPCAAALVAWGLRHHPRVGGVLAVLSLAATAWLLATGLDFETSAPWGPVVEVFPLYDTRSAWAHATIAAVVAGLLLLAARERHRMAQVTHFTRR
jgi:hypothetical protein